MKPLDVLGVRVETPTNQPIVLLREQGGDRCLPIWVGAAEAAAIAYAQQGVEPPRPLTHDLMINVISALGHTLSEVRIVKLEDRVFHAVLVLDNHQEIESRSSDAIALALRVGCPVMASEQIIEEAGVTVGADIDTTEAEPGAADAEVEKFKEFLDQVSADDFDTPS